MPRKININGSEKIICKYFDNGYCRFKEICKFKHPKENCKEKTCEDYKCPKRHPKTCKYFRRKKCKFAEKCLFKHDKNSEAKDVAKESLSNLENKELNNEIEKLKSTIENLTKEIELKDFILSAKESLINKLEEKLKISEDEIKKVKSSNANLRAELKDRDEEIVSIKNELKVKEINQTTCKDCGKMFETYGELRDHVEMEHNVTAMRLRNIAKSLMEEKEKHKLICEFSSKCQHSHACYVSCYFTDKTFVYVESESEDTDNEDEEDNDEDEYAENDYEQNQSIGTANNTCDECNFEAKNACGLKIHMKSEHKLACNFCDYKTTTKLILKKHESQHQC